MSSSETDEPSRGMPAGGLDTDGCLEKVALRLLEAKRLVEHVWLRPHLQLESSY